MELDTEMEYCSTDITNENKSNTEIIHTYDAEEDEDDNCVVVDKGEKQLLPASIRLLAGNICAIDDEPWTVEEGDDFIEDNLDNPKITPQKTVGDEKIEKSSPVISKVFSNVKETEEKLHLKNNYVKTFINSELGKIFENIFETDNALNIDQLKMEEKSEFGEKFIVNENISNDLDLNVINKIAENTKYMSGISYSTSLPGPSYSMDLPGPSCSTPLPGPSSLTSLPGPYNSKSSSTKLDTNLNKSSIEKDNTMENLINTICNDFFRKIETTNTNTDTNQDYSEFPKLGASNENEGNFECFQEDPDTVNPDIMYNIDLNEHYKYMDLLVQKIENATSKSAKQTVLNECMQLMPIPQIEHEPQLFTDDERSKFSNGICEWEYKIERDDWDKIMIKRAVIFTAHAGFDEANEESLSVLSDIIIHYIKRLAIIMKKNFDLQCQSSCPDKIDPIDNSLQEIGVKGGLRELFKHRDNDIFGRRRALIDKCKELQKIIDKFVEQTKNTLFEKANEEISTNKEVINEGILIDKRDKTKIESKSMLDSKSSIEGNTDIQQNLEHAND
uniref:Bromodomain associated domain-containing protein n=1 Tax=Schizaphis graminum TaxID=13262 RepID=A0A2S2P726_SCHGA